MCLVVLLLMMLRLPHGLGVDPFIVFFPFCDEKEIRMVSAFVALYKCQMMCILKITTD